MRLFCISWYISLILASGIMLFAMGDPSAALVLAIVLPLSCLLSTRGQVMATTSAVAILTLAGGYLSTRLELDPTMRSMAMSVALAAPVIGLLSVLPAWIAWMARAHPVDQTADSMGLSVALENQSSTKFMSDSTAIGSLGKLTPDTNRSKAA